MESQGSVSQESVGTVVSTRLPVFGHAPFSGTYRTRMEANGRLVLPAALRSPFLEASAAHVMPRTATVLWLLTPQGFDVLADALHTDRTRGIVDPRTRARFYMRAPKVSVDRQSRLVVPPELRERAGISGEAEVVLAGAIEHVELWPAQQWDAEEAARLDDADLLFEGFEGLPTGPA